METESKTMPQRVAEALATATRIGGYSRYDVLRIWQAASGQSTTDYDKRGRRYTVEEKAAVKAAFLAAGVSLDEPAVFTESEKRGVHEEPYGPRPTVRVSGGYEWVKVR
jgi:hypothetical protein